MHNNSFLWPLLFGVAVALGSIPPTQASASPLTLSEVFTSLESTSPELWNARLRIADARAEVSANRAVPNPAIFGTNEELSGTGETVRETTISVRQELSFLWSRQPMLHAARSTLNAEQSSMQEQRFAAQSSVLLNLLRLKQLYRELDFLDSLTVRYESVSSAASAREREGDISGYDAARVRMQSAEIYQLSAALRTNLRFTLSSLQKMTGLSESDLLSVELTPIAAIAFSDPSDAVSYAREHSPELQRTAFEERSSASRLNAAKWRRLPKFSIGIGQKSTNLDEDGLYIEGELELPLFSQRTRDVQRARVQQRKATSIRKSTDHRLEDEINRVFLHWKILQSPSSTAVNSDEVLRTLQTATSLYLSGETGYLELLDAFSSSVSTLQSIFALEHAQWQADLALRHLTGYPILETN
jgi:outer membrane protein TolC